MATCPDCRREIGPGAIRCACGHDFPAGAPASVERCAFAFRGTGNEYFGIWIVNTLLKIVTLGFYTAWAKVRTRSYFAGSTLLAGEPFAYLAEPRALFRGWLVAVAAFLVYTIATRVGPVAGGVAGAAIFCLVPWVIVRSRMFNLRHLAWRNIRFAFRPDYREAYVVYLGLLLLVPPTLGLIYPYILYRQKRFQVENGSYGATRFRFTATPGEFYSVLFRTFAAFLGVFVLQVVLAGMFRVGTGPSAGSRPFFVYFIVLQAVLSAVFYLAFVGWVRTVLANLAWNRTELGPVRFESTMRPATMTWLYLSGGVAIACSLGLLFPWASMRWRRYRMEHLAVHAPGGIDGFVAGVRADAVGAAGEEIGDLFGLDVDIAL